jgi:hypothetical protein
MITDIHSLQLVLLCQISRSAPNILWSLGSSLQNQFLQTGGGNPAVIVAKVSLKSMLERHTRKPRRVAGIAKKALANKILRA